MAGWDTWREQAGSQSARSIGAEADSRSRTVLEQFTQFERAMKRHYLKIPATIKDWFPGAAPQNWRELILQDATEGGTCIRILPLAANAQGVRAAVFGDEFYFEIGRDQRRAD